MTTIVYCGVFYNGMDADSDFKPGQIVRLTCKTMSLYTEVIQVVPQRQICWVRPLLLVESIFNGEPNWGQSEPESPPILYDLRQGSDLILPLSLFCAALDTEVIPLMMQLDAYSGKTPELSSAHQQLQTFVHQVWQTYPEAF